MRQLDVLATVLLIVGALNWGLVGIARFDLVAALFGMQFGETSALTSVVYGLVGLAGVYRALAFNGVERHTTPHATRKHDSSGEKESTARLSLPTAVPGTGATKSGALNFLACSDF